MAYYWVDKQHKNKLDPTTSEEIFIGYDLINKHYILYSIKHEKVKIVRDAKINRRESLFLTFVKYY